MEPCYTVYVGSRSNNQYLPGENREGSDGEGLEREGLNGLFFVL